MYSVAVYDEFDAMVLEGASKGASKGPARGQQGATVKEEEVRSKEEEVPQLQDQKQDQRITAGAAPTNPISQLGDMVVAMGLPAEHQTYSWIGGLAKTFGMETCRTFLADQTLKGASVQDFKGEPKNFKAYFTAAISKRAAENGRAAAEAAKPQYKIGTVSGMPVTNLARRERQIHAWIRDYEEYYNLTVDPDKGKPGVTVFVSDERVQEIWIAATAERKEQERLGREEGQKLMAKMHI